ncbi:hypothetical protein [Frigoriflavimonas asaccharolytica]|uniref:DUF3037 domain-containing protein n=1 Tax=Frigoriflavimonas asaccharolytica TaxID=2735899 RepID=A0A8J8GDG7_9FLAO|nr:hypothetical protein [Frigoriflavimonas asaccharolytica]NRS93772.1 hypothetical protein [Frigoriflavimonas asaccharolytica]
MKTYYTILKLSTNTIVGDSLSIGLLVCRGNKYWLKVSEHKKNIAKKLLGDKENSVDFVIKQLSTYLKQLNSETQKSNLFTFESFITEDYINYLNVYANGILQFSKASALNDDFDDLKFSKLYSLLIEKNIGGKNEVFQDIKSISLLEQNVQDRLISKVRNRIHTEITIDNSVLKSIYFNYEMDCLGLNGSFVGAKSLSLDHTVQTLEKNVSHYVTLIALLSQKYDKNLNNNKFFLIADEPLYKTPAHKFWEEMKDVSTFKLISSEEVEQVAEIVDKTDARKFLQENY